MDDGDVLYQSGRWLDNADLAQGVRRALRAYQLRHPFGDEELGSLKKAIELFKSAERASRAESTPDRIQAAQSGATKTLRWVRESTTDNLAPIDAINLPEMISTVENILGNREVSPDSLSRVLDLFTRLSRRSFERFKSLHASTSIKRRLGESLDSPF